MDARMSTAWLLLQNTLDMHQLEDNFFGAVVVPDGLLVCYRTENISFDWCISRVFCNTFLHLILTSQGVMNSVNHCLKNVLWKAVLCSRPVRHTKAQILRMLPQACPGRHQADEVSPSITQETAFQMIQRSQEGFAA